MASHHLLRASDGPRTSNQTDPAVRAAQLAALRRSIAAAQATLDQWTSFQADYRSLKATLVELPTRVSHQVMVPLGPLAFMPGKLVHTNEVTVLLGDNWFVERSAAQAADIVQRRMDFVAEKLQDAKSTVSSLQSKLQTLDPSRPPVPIEQPEELPELNEEGLPFMDIREDVDNPTIPTKSPLPPSPVSPAPALASKKSSKTKKTKANHKKQAATDPLAHARQVVAQFAATGAPPPLSADDRAALDAMFGNLSMDGDDDDDAAAVDDAPVDNSVPTLPSTPAVQSAVVERTPPPPMIDTSIPTTPFAKGPLPRKSSLKKSPSNSSLESRHVHWAMDDATTEEDSSACPTPTVPTAFARGDHSLVDTADLDDEDEDEDDDFDDDGDQVQVLVRPGKPASSSTAPPPVSRSAWAAAAAKRTAERAATTAANIPSHPPEPHARQKQSRRTNVPVRDVIVERNPPTAAAASGSESATDVEPSPPAPRTRRTPGGPDNGSTAEDDVDEYTHLREIATAYHAQRQHLVHQMLARSPLEPRDLANAEKQFALSPVDVARAELVAEHGSGPGFDPLMEMVIKKEVQEGDEPDDDEDIGYRLPIVDDVVGEIHLPVRRPVDNCGDDEQEGNDVGPVRIRVVAKDDNQKSGLAKEAKNSGLVGQVREAADPESYVEPQSQHVQPPKRLSKFKQARMSKQ